MSEPGASAERRGGIHDMRPEDMPRERLQRQGPGALKDEELLAIILRTGTRGEDVVSLSRRILDEKNGLLGLSQSSLTELRRVKGLGAAKATEVLAAMSLGNRLATLNLDKNSRQIGSAQDVADLLRPQMANEPRETLRLVLLTTRNHVHSTPVVYRGTVNSAEVRAGEVLREAVRENIPNVILVHNHPSGDPTPSREDVQMTARLVEAGKLLDIAVLDHIVIARGGHVSMKERRLGFD